MASTKLRLPQGTSRTWLLQFGRDLTGVVLAAFFKKSVFDADADALVDVSARLTVLDAAGGTALFSPVPADTADLDSFTLKEWQARATLADASVIALEAHQGPLVFVPLTGDPDIAEPPNDYIEEITAAMTSFASVLNDITALYAGTAVSLDGLSAALLAALPAGTLAPLRFDLGGGNRLALEYRLRAKAGGEVDTPATGRLVTCDHDAARVWELNREPSWNGMPCTWDDVAQGWRPITGYGAAASVLDAIVLPA